jgi:hypothetical protein
MMASKGRDRRPGGPPTTPNKKKRRLAPASGFGGYFCFYLFIFSDITFAAGQKASDTSIF